MSFHFYDDVLAIMYLEGDVKTTHSETLTKIQILRYSSLPKITKVVTTPKRVSEIKSNLNI